ncbi:hypothetical protein TD95_005455 [Thielaviopsis punctulata]|uniref:Major facilitator superfamily (MFS) profile domain-containing protein n=1 Tax=Thielaviopsis punctulata TaxID=72032 RepID=A0A0F4ZGN5_9PEZI|nr:hypothetical protein TD95_005455 [Thielaviopsis punctulata]
MADTTPVQKVSSLAADEKVPPSMTALPTDPAIAHPTGWQHKKFSICGHELWYASPKVQLLMVAIVCFMCPGMFNALSGMGGGGQVDTKPSNDANTALYSTFAVVAFFAGTIANVVGVRLTLSLGGIGYAVYVAAFLCYNHTKNRGFIVFSGAFLGVCAGLLWTAQGAIMMSYPPENSKGRYISWFWAIFNMGAVIGALIPLGQNIHRDAGPVTDGTYAGFLALTLFGALLALLLCNAENVVREDGSKVILMKNPTWKSEFIGLYETIVHDPYIILLFPMFMASNIFYTYQLNDMNALNFNTRTRALNNLLYWLAQIIGALVYGYCLDFGSIGRAMRAKIAWGVLFVLTFVIWGGGWAWQKNQPPREVVSAPAYAPFKIDWSESDRYIGPMFLFFFYGLFDALWQTSIYWFMGALSNSGRKAANLAGIYKSLQSAFAAIWWAMDGKKVSFDAMFGSTWGMLAGGLLFAAPIIFIRIKDTVSVEEDLKFSDETVTDVLPPSRACDNQENKV